MSTQVKEFMLCGFVIIGIVLTITLAIYFIKEQDHRHKLEEYQAGIPVIQRGF